MFSLQHSAKVLVNVVQDEPHSAASDAALSVRLYNLYLAIKDDADKLKEAHWRLLNNPVDASFAKKNPTYDGVCMGQKKTCTCGAPFFF